MSALALVYAVRRASDGAVKIGRTCNLQYRLQTLRAEHGLSDLVFVHPVLRKGGIAGASRGGQVLGRAS